MPEFFFAFYGEGKAEYEFLLRIIGRYLKKRVPYADFEPSAIHGVVAGASELERQRKLAEDFAGLHFIIVHHDADAASNQTALSNHFLPEAERKAKNIVPIIPIKETEAWLLVDFEAFKKVIGTSLSAKELNFPSQAHQVETINDPKEFLNRLISQARSRRRRIELGEIYEAMGENVSLEQLMKVPAFQVFHQDMSAFLSEKLGLRDLEQL